MPSDNPPSAASIAGHPVHAMLAAFPIACFTGALVTDLAYYKTEDFSWATFSIWLIVAGLVLGGLAAVAGLVDFARSDRIRRLKPAWPHAVGNALAWVLALFNAFVHSRDGYTAVVPTGLTLSVLTVLLLAITAWLGGSMVYRHGVGVSN